jgi:hypothetical protein
MGRASLFMGLVLFLVYISKDKSIKNVMLKDCLYVSGLMESLFSWSKLKSLNQYYLKDRGDMLVCKIVNNEMILWVKECLCTHLFNIPTRTLEAHTIFTFWYKALGYSSHDLMKYVNVFSDGDCILSKPKNFDCDSYLQLKSTHRVLKTLQDHVKSKFDIIYSNVHGPLAVQSLGGKRYFVMFIDEFSQYI